jgi:hypothetical protein
VAKKPAAKRTVTPKQAPKKEAVTEALSLVERIREAHFDAEHGLQTAMRRAWDAGNLLLQAKEECKHGEWEDWIKANLPFKVRTAQFYMQIARKWDGKIDPKAQWIALLPLASALKLLTQDDDGVEDPPKIEQKSPPAAVSVAAASVPAPVVPDGQPKPSGSSGRMSADVVASDATAGGGPRLASSDSGGGVEANSDKEIDEWVGKPGKTVTVAAETPSAAQATPESSGAPEASEGKPGALPDMVKVASFKTVVRQRLEEMDGATLRVVSDWMRGGCDGD